MNPTDFLLIPLAFFVLVLVAKMLYLLYEVLFIVVSLFYMWRISKLSDIQLGEKTTATDVDSWRFELLCWELVKRTYNSSTDDLLKKTDQVIFIASLKVLPTQKIEELYNSSQLSDYLKKFAKEALTLRSHRPWEAWHLSNRFFSTKPENFDYDEWLKRQQEQEY